MNRIFVVLLIIFNVIICVYLWLHWKSSKDDGIFVPSKEWKPTGKDQYIPEYLKDDGVFIPTKEWKPIGKDQPIPKGLHVRINFQTGAREAKLLEDDEDSDDEKKHSLVLIPDEGEVGIDNGNVDIHDYKYELIKESLKNIKNEAVKEAEDQGSDSLPKKKFRTYEQLKEELSELKMTVKTDVEVLNDLFKEFDVKYKKTGKVCSQEEPELEAIFRNLETLLHQVDNAEEFSRRNGFSEIILPCLSSNSTSMRIISARVLGAAVQNNPKVQITALQAGVITPLLKTVALTKNYEARASSIFALSCLIRSFPFAEIKLIDEGGLDVLLSLFDETSADALKLQIKVVNLFYDLILEKEDAEQTIEEEKLTPDNGTTNNETLLKEMRQMQEKLKQYKKIDLKTKLVERGWCTKLGHVFVIRIPDTNFALAVDVQEDAVDHDIVDKVSKAMISFATECRQKFLAEDRFSQIIKNLLTYYERLISKDELYEDIHEVVQQLNKEMNVS